jgi:hypothetical protein
MSGALRRAREQHAARGSLAPYDLAWNRFPVDGRQRGWHASRCRLSEHLLSTYVPIPLAEQEPAQADPLERGPKSHLPEPVPHLGQRAARTNRAGAQRGLRDELGRPRDNTPAGRQSLPTRGDIVLTVFNKPLPGCSSSPTRSASSPVASCRSASRRPEGCGLAEIEVIKFDRE